MKRFRVGSFVLVLLLIAGAAVAQEQTAVLQGTVTDASGSALPGVTVEAVSARGQRFSTTSDSSGRYRFPSLPPGSYTVTGTLSGMEPKTIKNVAVSLGSSPKVDLTLGVAAVAETMTVTAEAPLVDVTSNAAQTSVTAETIEKLPRGRDFASLVTIAPSANDNAKTGGISIDGATGSENRYIMDGVDTTNPQTGVQGKILVTDFVEEVQVKAGGYQAEFGGATGGVINVVTKTGTNDFRGTAGVTYNDRSWGGDPRPVLQLGLGSLSSQYEQFTAPKDDNTLIEPGVSLGGPILKDRIWFYAGYQPWTQTITRTVNFLNSDRTVRTTRSFDQDFTRNNLLANLSGAIGSRFLYKATYNDSGYETDNTLPNVNGRGNENADYSVNDELENWTASGYADLIASPEWFFSARGGRYHRNYSTSPTSNEVDINFLTGSPGATVAGGGRLFPEI
ncbi:MAG TPA: TonB-dependent receptor, partial [Thermoanaerobaculia bacterium]